MKTSYALRFAIAALAFATAAGTCAQPASSFTQRSFVGDYFFLGFLPETTEWMSIEGSDDLSTWTQVGSVATTNAVTVFIDQNAVTRSRCFYRLKQPGVAVEEAESRWGSNAGSDYRLQLQHVRNYGDSYVLSAHVTVTGGEKSLSNAEADGQPLDQPSPDDFPAVEELFAALKEAAQLGCWRVAVTYDETTGYPVWCVIERLMSGGLPLPQKRIDEYRITNLTMAGNGS